MLFICPLSSGSKGLPSTWGVKKTPKYKNAYNSKPVGPVSKSLDKWLLRPWPQPPHWSWALVKKAFWLQPNLSARMPLKAALGCWATERVS